MFWYPPTWNSLLPGCWTVCLWKFTGLQKNRGVLPTIIFQGLQPLNFGGGNTNHLHLRQLSGASNTLPPLPRCFFTSFEESLNFTPRLFPDQADEKIHSNIHEQLGPDCKRPYGCIRLASNCKQLVCKPEASCPCQGYLDYSISCISTGAAAKFRINFLFKVTKTVWIVDSQNGDVVSFHNFHMCRLEKQGVFTGFKGIYIHWCLYSMALLRKQTVTSWWC